MKYETLPNSDLRISLEKGDRQLLFDGRRRGDGQQPDFGSDDFMFEVFERLIANSELDWAQPEYIGALTSAPILVIWGEERPVTPGEGPDYHYICGCWHDRDGVLKTWTRDPVQAWGFMNYGIRSPQEDLFNDGFVVFQSGGVPEKKGASATCLRH